MLSVLINIKNFQHSNCELIYVIAVSTRFRNTVHLVKGKVFKAPTILRTSEYPQHFFFFLQSRRVLKRIAVTIYYSSSVLLKLEEYLEKKEAGP